MGNQYNFRTLNPNELSSKSDKFIQRLVERNHVVASNRNSKVVRMGEFETPCMRDSRKEKYVNTNVSIGSDKPYLISQYD